MKCPNCGLPMAEDAFFCAVCSKMMGMPTNPDDSALEDEALEAEALEAEALEAEALENCQRDGILPPSKLHPIQLIKQGWEIYKKNFGTFLVGMVLYTITIHSMNAMTLALKTTFEEIPPKALAQARLLLAHVALIIQSIFTASFIAIALKTIDGKMVAMTDVFNGFKRALPVCLFSIVSSVLLLFGCCFFIAPGVYLLVCYTFALHLIVDRNISFWEAMELSRKAVHPQWYEIARILLVYSVFFIASILGFIFFIYSKHASRDFEMQIMLALIRMSLRGLQAIINFVANPVFTCATTVAFTKIFQRNIGEPLE